MQEDVNNGTFDLFEGPIEPTAEPVDNAEPQELEQPSTPTPVEAPKPTPEPVSSDDDFFNIGDWPEGHPRRVEEPKDTESEPVEPSTPTEPRTDPTRFEYWQSQATKAQNQLREAEPLLEIASFLQQNPQVLGTLKNQIAPDPVNPQQSVQQPQELVKPTRPVKPSDYDSVAAHNDPESPSYKWREAMDEYHGDIADYYEKKEAIRQEAADLAAQQAQRTMAVRQQMSSLANELVMEHGFKANEAKEFVTKYSDPRSVTLDNLIRLYRLEKQTPSPPVENNQLKKDALINRRSNMQVPLPSAVTQSSQDPTQQYSDEDLFNASLRAAGRPRRR